MNAAYFEVANILLALHPAGCISRTDSHRHLSRVLREYFIPSLDGLLLDGIINVTRVELALSVAADKGRAELCSDLAVLLELRFDQTGDIVVLEEAIQLHREALALLPTCHPLRAASCTGLPGLLQTRYAQTGDVTLLEEAVQLHKEVLDLRPIGHPDRGAACTNLATSLHQLFIPTKKTALLDEATALLREALSMDVLGNQARATAYGTLAQLLLSQIVRSSPRVEVFDECVRVGREALALTPANSPLRADLLTNLAMSLQVRLTYIPVDSLQECIAEIHGLLTGALALYPYGHLRRWSCLFTRASVSFCRRDYTSTINDFLQALESPTPNAMTLVMHFTQFVRDFDIGALSDEDRRQLLKAHEHTVDLMVLSAGTAFNRPSQLQWILNGTPIGSSAFMLACQLGDLPAGLLLLERTRGVIWTQSFQLREPELDLIPSDLAEQMQNLIESLNSPAEAPRLKASSYLPPRDLLYEQRSRLQSVLSQIRALPGLNDFMRGPGGNALMTTAAHHPVVVLITDEKECHALIIQSSSKELIDLRLDVDTQSLQNLTFSAAALQKRGGDSVTDDAERAMKVSKAMSAPHAVLAKIWRSIVRPVIDRLEIVVRNSHIPVDRQVVFSTHGRKLRVKFGLDFTGVLRASSHLFLFTLRGYTRVLPRNAALTTYISKKDSSNLTRLPHLTSTVQMVQI
jgi:hypothetical protein